MGRTKCLLKSRRSAFSFLPQKITSGLNRAFPAEDSYGQATRAALLSPMHHAPVLPSTCLQRAPPSPSVTAGGCHHTWIPNVHVGILISVLLYLKALLQLPREHTGAMCALLRGLKRWKATVMPCPDRPRTLGLHRSPPVRLRHFKTPSMQ